MMQILILLLVIYLLYTGYQMWSAQASPVGVRAETVARQAVKEGVRVVRDARVE
jgi:threonine/homoserine/homoserine lactone efflux protein